MSALRVWTGYLLFVFLGGALMAPPLFWLVQALARTAPAFESLAGHPFHRFVSRSLLILALAGLWPLLRRLRMDSWAALGWRRCGMPGRRLAGGVCWGVASVGLTAATVLWVGVRVWRPDLRWTGVLADLGASMAAGLVVAAIEETLFRGALQGAVRRERGWGVAVAVSTVVYAVLHFFARVRYEGPVTWGSGFEVLVRFWGGLAEPRALVPGFLNLVLAGVVLGVACERSGSLHFAAGLHAAWVSGTKFFAAITRDTDPLATALEGRGRMLDGWAALGPLMLCLVLLPWILSRLQPRTPA